MHKDNMFNWTDVKDKQQNKYCKNNSDKTKSELI